MGKARRRRAREAEIALLVDDFNRQLDEAWSRGVEAEADLAATMLHVAFKRLVKRYGAEKAVAAVVAAYDGMTEAEQVQFFEQPGQEMH